MVLLNRLVFLRRVLSDSDLGQKICCIGEKETKFHVYHSNTINEHSVELNLTNTYGSESELHVWSHDFAEQRRFLSERQQQTLIPSNSPQSNLSHIEQMVIKMQQKKKKKQQPLKFLSFFLLFCFVHRCE